MSSITETPRRLVRSTFRRSVAALTLVLGCNALLDNGPRSLDQPSGAGGGFAGSTSGAETGNGGQRPSGGALGGDAAGGFGNDAGSGASADGGGAAGASAGANVGAANAGGAANGGALGGDAGTAGSGACGECIPGVTAVNTQLCTCNRGTQTQTRTCAANCTWGQWSAFGACSVVAECQPGSAAQTRTVDCETCKTQTQSRSCSSTCTFGAWAPTSSCPAASDCDYCASVEWCTDPDTGGTTCKQAGCTRDQALRDCKLDITTVCGATKQPLTMKYQ